MTGGITRGALGDTTPALERRPGAHRSRPTLRRWIVTGVVVTGFLLAALFVAASIGAAAGVTATLLGCVLAVIPLGIVIPTFMWLDRFESEPTRYLLFAFGWGACVAVLIALVLNTAGSLVLWGSVPPEESMALTAVFVAPVVEEAAKGLAVLLIWWSAKREFDGITDGMVYAGITAAGFAFTENIQYLSLAWVEHGQQGLTATFVVRCLLSPFAHPMFTVCIGVGIGVAASSARTWVKWVAPIVGYVVAVLAHAVWNFGAVSGSTGMLTAYLLIQVPLFLTFVAFVMWARRREGRLIGEFLTPYAAAGWFTPTEVAMLSTMRSRREARRWAKMTGGQFSLPDMDDFQDTASELALLRRRMHHSAADDRALHSEREMLEVVMRRRRQFVGEPV